MDYFLNNILYPFLNTFVGWLDAVLPRGVTPAMVFTAIIIITCAFGLFLVYWSLRHLSLGQKNQKQKPKVHWRGPGIYDVRSSPRKT